jgi:3-deoxy-7-phosphoheptulonate synthase
MTERYCWRQPHAAQQPVWPDLGLLDEVVTDLAACPPLVTLSECDRLREHLALAASGGAFVLQVGDCAETFRSVSPSSTSRTMRMFDKMADSLSDRLDLPVVVVGRIAGQYGKPRSQSTETRQGVTLPVYRGDAVNGIEFTPEMRKPDPRRLLKAYQASAVTLSQIRSIREREPTEFFISHEALLLPYESALVRRDGSTGRQYGSSGHLLWIGERTRQIDGAHVAFAAPLSNPLGVKLGPMTKPDELRSLLDRLDPDQQPGKLTLITRFGAEKVRDVLPSLVECVKSHGNHVVWLCDPMHGNTVSATGGYKTRLMDDVFEEVVGFLEVQYALGSWPGGLHLEVTADDVTECLGGRDRVSVDDLPKRYETTCDPRFNRNQSLEFAQSVADLLKVPLRVSQHTW